MMNQIDDIVGGSSASTLRMPLSSSQTRPAAARHGAVTARLCGRSDCRRRDGDTNG
jgi:hypothetical protein